MSLNNPRRAAHKFSCVGSAGHVSGELIKMLTGLNMVHVPYRGAGPALIDLISGQLRLMFDSMPSSIEYVSGGKLRPLAVTTTKRKESFKALAVTTRGGRLASRRSSGFVYSASCRRGQRTWTGRHCGDREENQTRASPPRRLHWSAR